MEIMIVLFVAVVLTLILAIVALLALRRRPMDEISRFLWTFFIALIPILGPVLFFIVHPENLSAEQREIV